MLPEGWKSGKLADQLDQIIDYRGTSVPKAKSGIPLITARNVRRGFLDLNAPEYIDPNAEKEWMSRGYPCAGDVLFTTEAPLGNVAKFPENGKFCIGQRVVALRTKKHVLTSDFLLYQLLSDKGKDLINERSSGSTAKGIKTKELKKVIIPLPPLPEQKKIAAILSTWDRAIEVTEKLLANSQQQKKALMQQLLTGKKRLPGFTGEWKKHVLSDFFARMTSRNTAGCTNVVTMSAQEGLIRQEEYFKKSVASDTLDGYFLMKKGDFAYNKSYSNGYPMGAIKRLNRYEEGVVTTLYICFRLQNTYLSNGDFFEAYFDAGMLNVGLTQIAHEGGRAHGLLNVKPADFMSLRLVVPGGEEQKAIASVLTKADEEVTLLKSDLSRLRQEKKALMQQLLTGKRRVKIEADAG
ncbi:restriction endonuclease subunit S [Asaia bogorensis]|uniref:restriction endonuclease subunit S n=1 Tax=Asaia bogorensis TaxID=91915 RepID=UPI00285F3697|nr:restriction endonuclease subunit S [Asaia bogorensis]MDR6182972.1 type I restriction enzyme S subunit [Asaia bogorensis NBRC 16594]